MRDLKVSPTGRMGSVSEQRAFDFENYHCSRRLTETMPAAPKPRFQALSVRRHRMAFTASRNALHRCPASAPPPPFHRGNSASLTTESNYDYRSRPASSNTPPSSAIRGNFQQLGEFKPQDCDHEIVADPEGRLFKTDRLTSPLLGEDRQSRMRGKTWRRSRPLRSLFGTEILKIVPGSV